MLAKTVSLSTSSQQTHCVRQQAGSYRGMHTASETAGGALMPPRMLRVTRRKHFAGRTRSDAERRGMHAHAERGNDQALNRKIVGAQTSPFPAKAGPTRVWRASNDTGDDLDRRTGFSREAVDLPKRAFDLDLPTQKVQSPPIATWVQAERRSRGVGRAAWMRRERRQDMDVRSARAHGAGPE
ncbi:hypothetical protein EC919_104495 [Pseudomonas graminis]|nr:hypothetical protein EC919_104495 [Pseudomonas graminis]